MKFYKEKMLERVKKNGLIHLVGEAELAIMDNMDGCTVSARCFRRVVFHEPVYWCIGKDGTGNFVHEDDCE